MCGFSGLPCNCADTPRLYASIIVRSYRRPGPLLELLERLRRQSGRFEIVVVEQTEDADLLRALKQLAEPRLRVVARAPLGAPAARNEGIRHARGEVLAFIDDDDLPIGDNWLSLHLANYADKLCQGVSGRLVQHEGPPPPPGPWAPLVRWAAMRHTLWKDSRALAGCALRKENIDFLMGSNASVRRSLIDRIGGWDEGVPMGEEQSFAFKFARMRAAGEYFVHDPKPMVWRRTTIAGGLDRRTRPHIHRNELWGRIIYYHHVVGYYFPWRFRLLYPLYLLRLIEQVARWIWDPDNRHLTLRSRLAATVGTVTVLPSLLYTLAKQRGTLVRRVPVLRPVGADVSLGRDVTSQAIDPPNHQTEGDANDRAHPAHPFHRKSHDGI